MMEKTTDIEKLKEIAKKIRIDIVDMIYKANSGHPGGSLSSADIITTLYFAVMNHDPKNPQSKDRDRFILSKGHVCPALYSALAECGYFPREWLDTLRKVDSKLQGHPQRLDTPGVEASTGSLGQGLSIAVGNALGLRLDKSQSRVFCLMGDGEQDEGNIWEAAMAAAHYNLSNLTGIVDVNGLQIDGKTSDVMNIEPIAEKYKAFGWHAISINGHDFNQLVNALSNPNKEKPTVIIAKTIKGKGVSFMENKAGWHGKAPNDEEYQTAIKDLKGA